MKSEIMEVILQTIGTTLVVCAVLSVPVCVVIICSGLAGLAVRTFKFVLGD